MRELYSIFIKPSMGLFHRIGYGSFVFSKNELKLQES
jgi:hypothetical protein